MRKELEFSQDAREHDYDCTSFAVSTHGMYGSRAGMWGNAYSLM